MPRLRLRARPPFPFDLLIALASGLVLSLAFPPRAWWPLTFVALAPLLWLLKEARARRGFVLGLVFGVAAYGATMYWIWRFGVLAWIALTLLMGLSAGLFGILAVLVRRERSPLLTAFAWASAWTLVDWLRGRWPFGGFTWGALGISQVGNRATVRVATLAGVWGVTFLVALVNGLIVVLLTDPATRRRILASAVAVVAVLAPLAIPFSAANGRPIRVAAVQVDVRRGSDVDPTNPDLGVAQLIARTHRELAADPPDLAVWGEGALFPDAQADPATSAAVHDAIATVGSPTLVGAVTDDPDGRQYTNVLLYDGAGRVVDRYDKVHLVPFGEYVPFRRRLSWISALKQVPVDRTPGERVHTVSVAGLPVFGTPICFENSFPDIPRTMVREGAGFLVVTVNNASYGFTAASAQHEQMSRMRAIEDGRWVVNAAVSGISALIDPSGHVVGQEGLFTTGILRGTIRSSDTRTWYVRLGDWLPWLTLGFVVVMVALPRRRRTVRPTPAPLPAGFRTLVILPTYQESATVERVLSGVLSVRDVDVLVVDDSSPDGTGDLVAARAASEPRLRLLERPRKTGLASAYLEGFRTGLAEGYDLVVEMDSDLSHDPAELAGLLADASARYDLTVGSRYVAGGSVTNWNRTRVALSRAGNVYARLMLGVGARDATSGYRVYRAGLLKDLMAEPFVSDGYGFQIELVMRAWNLGYAVGESPITFREREHGESKISRGIIVEALWQVTRWGLQERFGAPLRPSDTQPP